MSTIKSRPTYAPLVVQPMSSLHVFVTSGEGSEVVQKLVTAGLASPYVWWHFTDGGAQVEAAVNFIEQGKLWEMMERRLPECPAGSHVYLAGNEQFIWSAALRARGAGFSREGVSTELTGSKARRVMCAHCRTLHESIKHTVFRCDGCGLWLGVRDHYSRLMQAYLAGRVDAEVHGEIPKPEELYA